MQNQLEKAINLAKKTNDRVIVIDKQNPDDIFVVMGLDEYEKLVIGRSEIRNLTEDELLDKINRDIAIWKSENDTHEWENDKVLLDRDMAMPDNLWSKDKYSDMFEEDDILQEDNMYYYDEDLPAQDLPQSHQGDGLDDQIDYEGDEEAEKASKNIWKIPSEVKDGAAEIL